MKRGGGQQREEGEKKTKFRLITLLSCYPGGQLWVVSLRPPPSVLLSRTAGDSADWLFLCSLVLQLGAELSGRQASASQHQPQVRVVETEVPADSAGLMDAALVQQLSNQQEQNFSLLWGQS